MKKTLKRLEPYRVKHGPMASTSKDGRNGMFKLPPKLLRSTSALPFTLMLSDASGWDTNVLGEDKWEHASMSLPWRCPAWDEMSRLKGLLFDEGETVLQFHPPKSQYVNTHEFCLHLWKPVGIVIPVPPMLAV